MKKITSLLLTMLLLFSVSTEAFAAEKDKTLALNKNNTTDSILIGMKSYKDMIKKDPKAKLVSRKESYYRIESKDGIQSEKQLSTKQQYLNSVMEGYVSKNVSIADDLTKSYGWIVVSTYAYKLSNGRYYIAFIYDWLKRPYYQMTDAIVLGADSNLNIYTDSIFAYHTLYYSSTSKTYYYDWSSSDMLPRGANTYGINVPMTISRYVSTQDIQGGISAEATPSNVYTTSAKYFGSYGHRQVAVSSPSVGFGFDPESLSFSFSLSISDDEAPLSDILRMY